MTPPVPLALFVFKVTVAPAQIVFELATISGGGHCALVGFAIKSIANKFR